MLVYVLSCVGEALVVAVAIVMHANRGDAGRHRGTREQIRAQEARRREAAMAYAQDIVRADLIANGARADYVLTEV